MSNIFDQLGINWQLFLSQAVNFFILLIILRQFVYKPLLLVMKKRRETIEEGLQKAKEADVRLAEVDVIAAGKLKKADAASVLMIKDTQAKAEALQQELQKKAEDHQKELMAQIELSHRRQQEETKQMVFAEAMELVKKTLVKTVELKPEMVDEALIKKAVLEVKKEV